MHRSLGSRDGPDNAVVLRGERRSRQGDAEARWRVDPRCSVPGSYRAPVLSLGH